MFICEPHVGREKKAFKLMPYFFLKKENNPLEHGIPKVKSHDHTFNFLLTYLYQSNERQHITDTINGPFISFKFQEWKRFA